MFVYSVRCDFTESARDTVDQWLSWMCSTHIQEVLEAGAAVAELIEIESDLPCFQVNYQFESVHAFARYESEHAPRLRHDSLKRFPISKGISYSRTLGEIRGRFPKKTEHKTVSRPN